MEKEKHPHEKEYTIIVNSREKTWNEKEISYQEVIVLAFGSYSADPNMVYTITYAKGEESRPKGSMVKGVSVKVKNGMIFNVTPTNKS
ncbi:MAG: hypothetical protein A2297_01290 [Elusimicrobia bacterium RIFOXYB2_FULL_48_7]|nr:MAG: hypothetical protein A2297_01290 [Elusimicrobia bacterium RIFOXYB2_FULL_48_7]